MKKLFLFPILILLLTAIHVAAQAPADKNDLAIDVTLVRVNPHFNSSTFKFNSSTDQLGANIAFTHFFGKAFGLTVDTGFNAKGRQPTDSSLVTITGGPTLKAWRGKAFEPFVHGLFGMANLAATNQ